MCARCDISFRYGPITCPPCSATVAIIFSSSSSTMYSSSVSFSSARKRSRAARSATPPGQRKVPLIGFIITSPSSTLTWRSGLAPTSVRVPVCTTNVQYAPRSATSSRRSAASAAFSGGPCTVACRARWMTKFAPSPRPISSDSTRCTVRAYSSSLTSKPASVVCTGSSGSAARASVSVIRWCSRTWRNSSGAASSTQAKPRSVICRYGTRASVRAPGGPVGNGRSVSSSTVSTGPVNRSSSSAPSRRSSAKGPGSTPCATAASRSVRWVIGVSVGLGAAVGRPRSREIRRPPRWRPRGWSYAREMAAGSAGHQLVNCASM
ncbi:hypothetical protein GUI43_06282 [Micromonospora noduli]|nr:hypothetical protein GUI43_06282 [Micromonospora noduli]